MTKQRLLLSVAYWLIVLLIASYIMYQNSNEYKQQCYLQKGEVVDEINVSVYTSRHGRLDSHEELRPQILYKVGDSDVLYVDHETPLPIGATPVLLLKKSDPYTAKVYDFGFWLDMGVLYPAFLIGAFIYSIIAISVVKDGSRKITLPGTLDEFTAP